MRHALKKTGYYELAGIKRLQAGAPRGGSKVRRALVITWVALFCIATAATAGDLWITSAPGYEVFLDGHEVGVSRSGGTGISLIGIEPGEHTIRIEKDGFPSAEYSLTIGPAPTQATIVEPWFESAGGPPGTPTGEAPGQNVGTIEVTSDPKECTVELAHLSIAKEQPVMMIVGIPVGKHNLRFRGSETVLKKRVAVRAAQPALVRVDFRHKTVAVVGDAPNQPGPKSAVESESPAAEPECIEYWIQVVRTTNHKEIEPVQKGLVDLGFPMYRQKVITTDADSDVPVYKIRVGPIERRNMAVWAAGLIKHGGFTSAWILPKECQGPPEPPPKRRFKLGH